MENPQGHESLDAMYDANTETGLFTSRTRAKKRDRWFRGHAAVLSVG